MNTGRKQVAKRCVALALTDALLSGLRRQYASDRLVVMRQLAQGEEVNRILEESSSWRKETVHVCQEDGITWSSQDVPKDSFLHAWFLSSGMLNTVRSISSISSPLLKTKSWTNLYGAGEHITPHRDAAGNAQLLLALASPAKECGGSFFASVRGRLREISLLIMSTLRSHDGRHAILFCSELRFGTTVTHSSPAAEASRLVATLAGRV